MSDGQEVFRNQPYPVRGLPTAAVSIEQAEMLAQKLGTDHHRKGKDKKATLSEQLLSSAERRHLPMMRGRTGQCGIRGENSTL